TIQNVEGLEDGLYHYLPMGHKIEMLKKLDDLKGFISKSLEEQIWAAKANVVFYFSMVFYRAEWRYGIYAHRVTLIDAGHITENLYLACTAIGLGGCAIGAVDGRLADETFGLDGVEESIMYAMPVGTVSDKDKDKEQDFYAFVKQQGL
ncbi:MAG: SagB/ThcOx family dehydrogenase, partial [Erysipelotrichaceae bacterium]|nr:SagB/ThcOx family dehydrogenase [Erysipelotrichaceae bacterium]